MLPSLLPGEVTEDMGVACQELVSLNLLGFRILDLKSSHLLKTTPLQEKGTESLGLQAVWHSWLLVVIVTMKQQAPGIPQDRWDEFR